MTTNYNFQREFIHAIVYWNVYLKSKVIGSSGSYMVETPICEREKFLYCYEGKSLDEIRGSCIIEKASTFDASTQSWRQLTTGVGISNNFVFKVTNKCMLGMPQVAPPEIPT